MNYKERATHWILQEKYGKQIFSLPENDSRRLTKGEPADYIIGWSYFLGCKIDLSHKPLIPRPETEYWVGEAIRDISQTRKRSSRCLDIFAGSGCIGIALLKHLPKLTIDFADVNPECLKQIEINCEINGIAKDRFHIILSDIFANIKDRYDYVFGNPPYCATKKNKRVANSVIKFEPAQALWGGDDGLIYIKKFLACAKKLLKPKGVIYMEFDDIQKGEASKLIKGGGYGKYQFRKDQYGLWRWVTVR